MRFNGFALLIIVHNKILIVRPVWEGDGVIRLASPYKYSKKNGCRIACDPIALLDGATESERNRFHRIMA